MKYTIVVLGAPYSSQSAYSAYRFTQSLIASEHEVFRVLFYQDGVHCSSNLATPPQDEFDLYRAWQTLQKDHDLDLVVCIAAAARRGLINEAEAARHNKNAFNISTEFELSGLGQIVEATALCDRVITFGDGS